MRTASPLSKTATDAKPAASRITHSSALKKSTPGGAKKSVLGAKKAGNKLGVKKVVAADIDFDEAEKKAKEEAERIKELGYNPDEEEAEAKKAAASSGAGIVSPTPVSPPRGGYGAASHSREKSASEIERLGMGMGRLGFGQIGAAKKPAAAAKSSGGFGSVGPIKAAPADGMLTYPCCSISQTDLCTNSTYRRREFREKQVWQPEEHFLRRILRQGLLRPQLTGRGQDAAAGLRGRLGHLVQRLLWPSRGGGRQR